MDLMFPHHECEIAQSTAALGHESVHYWMHNNMITINGQKMGKSLGNFITLDEFFNGSHKLLSQAYAPMTIDSSFFRPTTAVRSISAMRLLLRPKKDCQKLTDTLYNRLMKLKPGSTTTVDVKDLRAKCEAAMCDDLNTPIVIFSLV